jgi:hypothetical protein
MVPYRMAVKSFSNTAAPGLKVDLELYEAGEKTN